MTINNVKFPDVVTKTDIGVVILNTVSFTVLHNMLGWLPIIGNKNKRLTNKFSFIETSKMSDYKMSRPYNLAAPGGRSVRPCCLAVPDYGDCGFLAVTETNPLQRLFILYLTHESRWAAGNRHWIIRTPVVQFRIQSAHGKSAVTCSS
jgi:hypothetical protein